MKLQNKNFLYNILYQFFVFIIPLLTTPYISRVLGVDNVGIYSYTYSIVYYFMLLAMLGITNYGSREIAKCSNKIERSKMFLSIYFLQIFMSIICIILYLLLTFLLQTKYLNIMLINICFLFSVLFDINWFFYGLEKFKITISRNIIIKLLSLIFVFAFVKNANDLWKYSLIIGTSTLISQMFLWLFIRKEIVFIKIKLEDVFQHLKPCIILFIPVIAYSIYRVMDKTMLGSIAGTLNLGYYENAEKIINIPVAIINALGVVMLPSMAKTVNDDELKEKILYSFKLILLFIIPIFFGLIVVSDNFSILFFGQEFEQSGFIIQLLSITFVFSAIANVIRTNYLIPKKLDKIYVKSTILGAIVNLIINSILIPYYGYIGASIGTICAEFIVMLYQIVKTKNFIDYVKVLKILFENIFKCILVFIVLIILEFSVKPRIIRFILQIIISIVMVFILNYDFIVYDFLNKKRR